jgi:hypothetical protein
MRVVAELGQAGHRAGDLRACVVPAGPGDLHVYLGTQYRDADLLDQVPDQLLAVGGGGRVPDGGMSAARARICSRSAAVSVRGRAAVNRSYSSPSRCRSASAVSQSFPVAGRPAGSGSASWYWRRARLTAKSKGGREGSSCSGSAAERLLGLTTALPSGPRQMVVIPRPR